MWNTKSSSIMEKCTKQLIKSKFLKIRLCTNLLLISKNYNWNVHEIKKEKTI